MEITYKRIVKYYETDAMQVVHHSNYIRYLEEARIYFMDKINMPYKSIEEQGILIPVIGINCTYKNPAKFDDMLDIKVKIKEYTGVKMVISYEIINSNTKKDVFWGETKHCFVNKEMKPISLKKFSKAIDEKLTEFLG